MEKPVQRDPRSGQLRNHPAYEGWSPRERSSWPIVAGCGLLVAFGLFLMRFV